MAYLLQRDYLSYKFTRFFLYFLFLSDEGPMLETLDHTIRIGSTPTFLYFDLFSISIDQNRKYNGISPRYNVGKQSTVLTLLDGQQWHELEHRVALE